MCQKIPYTSRADAKHAARQVSHKAGSQRPYYCIPCDRWHLTHLSSSEQRQHERRKRRMRRAA